MKKGSMIAKLLLVLMLTLMLMSGCGGNSSSSNKNVEPDAGNVNLIFVTSPDLICQTPGDVDPDTANLTSQGLQRSLMMASYLKQEVLGGDNVTGIYALEPMTHLQTVNNYPNMTAIGFIQPFALLNQITLPIDHNGNMYTGNSYPINVSYAEGQVPAGTAAPVPPLPDLSNYCPDCTGLAFDDSGGDNNTLVSGIIDKNNPGYYVFSAPWGTIQALLTFINSHYGYNLALPSSYRGTNYIYALSIRVSGEANLITYDSNLYPPANYPVLPAPGIATTTCTSSPSSYIRSAGVDGVTVPGNVNTNSTIYIVRHAEAHPDEGAHFDNGNYVAAGQWRALALADALADRITRPDVVYSIDPAGTWYPNGASTVSYVRPALTVLPYVIANNLPYKLAAELSLGSAFDPTDENVAEATSRFFFTGGTFTNKTVLVAWESGHIKPFLKHLIESYGGTYEAFDADWVKWAADDYDTIWTVTLDAQGNLTVDNALCEGIDSAQLPDRAPLF